MGSPTRLAPRNQITRTQRRTGRLTMEHPIRRRKMALDPTSRRGSLKDGTGDSRRASVPRVVTDRGARGWDPALLWAYPFPF
ncbi:hypothetical protein CGRA01v4_05330 [Colletotrichum graminicola]|nr:hypothetical protein CGRA01v4_05330 [Colletotrichum graminicola]